MTASERTDPGAATTTGDSSSHPLVDGSGQTPAEDVRSLAAKRALQAVTRHVRRRNAIRRVLEDVDQELQTAVDRAREAGAVDEQIVAAALAGQRRTNPQGRQS